MSGPLALVMTQEQLDAQVAAWIRTALPAEQVAALTERVIQQRLGAVPVSGLGARWGFTGSREAVNRRVRARLRDLGVRVVHFSAKEQLVTVAELEAALEARKVRLPDAGASTVLVRECVGDAKIFKLKPTTSIHP